MAALRLLIGRGVAKSLASRIARLPWRQFAPRIVLAFPLACDARACAYCQQVPGVFAVSHGFALRMVWGWLAKDCQPGTNRSMVFPPAALLICFAYAPAGPNRRSMRGLKAGSCVGQAPVSMEGRAARASSAGNPLSHFPQHGKPPLPEPCGEWPEHPGSGLQSTS
jgi:hypothetical protein